MCYHLVTYIEYECSHQVLDRRHYIDCNTWTCRLSRFHNPTEHDCAAECTETILPDQSIIMEGRRRPCDTCLGIIPAAPAAPHGMNGVGVQYESESEDGEEDDVIEAPRATSR